MATHSAWQQRRALFTQTVAGARNGDTVSQHALQAIVMSFSANNLDRTPLENMEILGVHHLAGGDIAFAMPLVVLNATLGWYDALRYASASGQEEIAQGLFKLPFVVAGPEVCAAAAKYFDEQPKRTAELVAEGINLARDKRGQQAYDEHWAAEYGLETTLFAETGQAQAIASLPENQWDIAWEEAEHRVRGYYR